MSARGRCKFQAPYLLPGSGDIALGYPHPPFTQSQETSLRTHSLNICTGKVILRGDKFLQIDVACKGHPRRMQSGELQVNKEGTEVG